VLPPAIASLRHLQAGTPRRTINVDLFGKAHESRVNPFPRNPLKIMPKSKYLSFVNKKYLTNEIKGCINCAMNANDVSPKASARLNRIKIVSRIAKIAMLGLLIFTLFFPIRTYIFQILSPSFKRGGFSLPDVLTTISQIILWVWYWKLFQLFNLYERGLIFSAQTIRCIKILGILCAIGWVLMTLLQLLPHPLPLSEITHAPPPGVTVTSRHTYREGFFSFDFGTGINFGLLFAGTVIVLIAWIMDEGRKIQEEQELTV
jgi:Protein of unknown function (DUF2975)